MLQIPISTQLTGTSHDRSICVVEWAKEEMLSHYPWLLGHKLKGVFKSQTGT